jgi:hypothetical protein
MRLIFTIWITLSLCTYTKLQSQDRFPCTGKQLISLSNGGKTEITYPVFVPFAPPFLTLQYEFDGAFDALGFNTKDSYIYGVEYNTNNIVRLTTSGFQRIGKVTDVNVLKVDAGDCSLDGYYFCYDFEKSRMLVFEVTNGFKLFKQFKLFWSPNSPNRGDFKTRIFDFAFDPNDPKTAYAFQPNYASYEVAPDTTKGHILKINLNLDDPNVGMVTTVSKTNENAITHIGALAFDPNSNLSGFGSSSRSINPSQNTFYNISQNQGDVDPIIRYPGSFFLTDGCSCPYPLQFTNFIPQDGIICNNDTKNFRLTVTNQTFIQINDVVLKDTFPEGTLIKSVSGNFIGKAEGIGTNTLKISQLQIPSKRRVEVIIELMTVNTNDGYYTNQAFLENLPLIYPTPFGSDEPFTSIVGDPSTFHVDTRKIDGLKWDVTKPSDCLKANDGKIVVTSAEFVPGQIYEVALRNQIGWEERYVEVTVDQRKSFTVDGLIPGKYQLFRIRIKNTKCSLGLKDTLIEVDAPNELLNLSIGSNSPVCEKSTLQFNSTSSPVGTIFWRGPNVFGSDEFNPTIERADTSRGGLYWAVAKYGFCEQRKDIRVAVKPLIEATIEGDTSYCLRDTLKFKAITINKGITYAWNGPNGFKMPVLNLTLPLVSPDLAGRYYFTVNNGACYDTLETRLFIRPTPTLSLPREIISDFCKPVIFEPKTLNNKDVLYKWAPSEGLTCDNCESPQLVPLFKNRYRVKVSNDFNCKDSAGVNIILQKENAIIAPNIFSPLSSQLNSLFVVKPNCNVRSIQKFSIYDRLGSEVYSSIPQNVGDLPIPWDGNIGSKQLTKGVYVWIASVELVDGTIMQIAGDIALI